MKKKRLIILLSFLIPIFILTGLALWIVTTDHVITPAYDEHHTLAQYFVEETNTSYDGNEKTPNFKDGVYTNDEDKENFLNTVDFYYKTKGTIGAYTEGLPTNAGTYSVKILEILDSNDNSDNQEGALYVTINISTVNPTLATAVSVSYANQTDGTTRSNYFVTSQKTSDITYTGSFKDVDGNTLEGTIKYSDTTYTSLQIGNDIEYAYTFTPSNSNYNTYSGKCKINTYATVKYFITSTTAPSKLLEVAKNTTLSQESDPSRSGYVFQGWYTNSSYTTVMDFSVPVTTDINIYAKWQEESFSITYNLNGGTVNGTNPTSYTYSSSTITLINPTKNGYDFLGWTGTGLSGKTMTVKINKGSSGDRSYTANWGIKLKLGIQSYNYTAGAANRQWNSFKTNFIPNLVKDSFEDILGNKIPLKVNENFSIISMTDGVNYYDSSNTNSYLIGSTYLVKVQLTTTTAETYSLYDIETDSYGSVGSFILKYKTAIVNGSYYTIEDAILTTSGNITLAGDNTANLYVSTAFTSLDSNQGNPYNSQDMFNISGRTLLVPFTSSNEEKTITNNSYNSNVYSVLTIPETKTLNFKSSGTLAIGAYMTNSTPNLSVTNQRGVLMNNGTINFENGSYLNSYGYLKGSGTVNLYNGSVATDVMRVYDWPGGNAASSFYKNAFPLNSWSIHNISCDQYYYGGATLRGYVFVSMSIPIIGEQHVQEYVNIIGPSSGNKCMFIPNSDTNENYIFKSSMNSLEHSTDTSFETITGSNQKNGQKDKILMHGNYLDQSISISMRFSVISVSLETSTSTSLPISFLDIELDEGTNLTLESSDYLFLPGTKVKINQDAVLNIGDDVDISFMESSRLSDEAIVGTTRIFTSFSVDHEYDAYCVNNGTISVNGSIGGKINTETSGALIDISTGAISTSYNMLYQTDSPYYFSGTCKATGEIKDFSDNYFVSGYFSSISENSTYLWKQETNLKFIKFDFYDDDGTTKLGSKTKALLGSETEYIFLGNEFKPTKTYYDFEKWTSSVNGESADNKIYSNTGSAGSTVTYNLYADWVDHQYKFVYNSGYGYAENGDIIYLNQSDVSYSNKIEYVTKSMLENGNVTLPTASYSINGVNKFFNGWFAGIDKTSGSTISTFTLSMLQKFVAEYGDGNDIPLYCEFTDAPILKVVYVVNHPDSNKTLSYPEGEVLQGEALDHPDVNQFDNVLTERYYFGGWYTQANGQGDKYDDDTTINSNITLYGHWIEKNSITYSTGTQLNIDLGLYQEFSSITYYYIPGASHSILLAEQPTETGHNFVGWTTSRKTDGSVEYKNDASVISTTAFSSKSTTLYASYTLKQFSISISGSANQTVTIKVNDTSVWSGTSVSGTTTIKFDYASKINISYGRASLSGWSQAQTTAVVTHNNTSSTYENAIYSTVNATINNAISDVSIVLSKT